MGTPDYTTDILIAGAGPAGAVTSIFLAKEKVNHIIIDKAIFPRDKICGDAMSGKTVGILKRITTDWQQYFLDNSKATVSRGIQFIDSDNNCLSIPFKSSAVDTKNTPGFVSKRIDFDNSLIKMIDKAYANFISDCAIESIEHTTEGLLVKIKHAGIEKTIFTKMIVGADGRGSIVAKKMAMHKVMPEHYSAGIRAYYSNVAGMHDDNYIELHFLKEMQPGYFWIFPLPNGMANVGMGMLSSAVAAKKANLKQLMLDAIEKHHKKKVYTCCA